MCFQVYDRCRSPGRVGETGRERTRKGRRRRPGDGGQREHATGAEHGGHQHDDDGSQEDAQVREHDDVVRCEGSARRLFVQRRRRHRRRSDRGRYAQSAREPQHAKETDRHRHRFLHRQTQVRRFQEADENGTDQRPGHHFGHRGRRRHRRSRVRRVRHLRADSLLQALDRQKPQHVRVAAGHDQQLRLGRVQQIRQTPLSNALI